MENQNEQTPTAKPKKIIISIIVILILAAGGFFAYQYLGAPNTFVSDEDCDQDFAIVFDFTAGINEEEARSIMESYDANIRTLLSWGEDDLYYGSICIENGKKYIFDGDKLPLLRELKKDERFQYVDIEPLAVLY